MVRGPARESQPPHSVADLTRTRFVNRPPTVAPTYFQDRLAETQRIAEFLKDDSKRLMTVVGRVGIGKTATVCRVLKSLERGSLPDDLGPLEIDGIVYLSSLGSRQVHALNFYEDLLRLLPEGSVGKVEAVVRNPETHSQAKMQALLEAFPEGRRVVLLDHFEDLVNSATNAITDVEIGEALNALLTLPHHGIKVILTTRVAPRALALVQPGRQVRLDFDAGLESSCARTSFARWTPTASLGCDRPRTNC